MYKRIDLTYFTIQKMLILMLIRSIYFKLKKKFDFEVLQKSGLQSI